MRKKCFIQTVVVVAIAMLSLIGCSQENNDEAAIRQVVEKYVQSINEADTTIVNAIWSHDPEVSFNAPSGYYKTYNEIRDDLVAGLFGKFFTERDLQSENLLIHRAGDMAWIEFSWKFDATRTDGQPHHTKGFETQIVRKDKNGDWKLVHIHYSGR